MSILLNPEIEQRIAAKVQSGQYQTADEVVQQSLDLLEARDAGVERPQTGEAQSIGEVFIRLGQQIPKEELANIPTDFARNIDHYLYGSPKEQE